MKWLLANPRPDEFSVLGKYEKVMEPFVPMGLAYLAAVLEEEGARVEVHDGFAAPEPTLLERAARMQPDAVGISCLTPAAGALSQIVPALRQTCPQAKIVLGNIHATLFARQLLEDGLADYIVHGEGEQTIRELNACLAEGGNAGDVAGLSFLQGGRARATPERPLLDDLDALPHPAWHLFDLSKYMAPPIFSFQKRLLPVLASRGCPFRCYFCAQNVMSPKLRKRRMTAVVDEIEQVHHETGMDFFWFCDAIFPLTREDAQIFCSEMTTRGLHKKIKWLTETRVDLVDRPLLAMMKKAGLYMVLYGLESGDQNVLSRIKQGVSLEAGRRAVLAARAEGVLTLGLFMVGLPGEDRTTIEKTIRFARETGLDFAKFNRAVPYPGSRFFSEVCDPDNLPEWETFSSNYEPPPNGSLAYRPESLTDAELVHLQKKAYFQFYVRPSLVWRHIAQGSISLSNMARGGGLVLKNHLESAASAAVRRVVSGG